MSMRLDDQTNNLKRIKKGIKTQNLHKSLKFVFVTAQIFGYFPVKNVLQNNIELLNFNWFSIKVISSFISMIGGSSVMIGHVRSMAIKGYNQFEMNGVVFYFIGVMANILFINLAQQWSLIMRKWQEIDLAMASYGWPKSLNKRIKYISVIFLLLEASEHFLIQANKFTVAVHCKGGSFSAGLAHFSVNMSFPMIFNTIPYNPVLAVIYQMVNTRMAFAWTFSDLFIILISCSLVSRFQQVNLRVRYLRDHKVEVEQSWARIHDDYNRLCRLCDCMDKKMSWLILLSFFTNFYFLIFQVFESLKLRGSPTLEIVYYFISLSLLILRIVSVTLYGSWVHEESRVSLDILNSTTYEYYNKEIERFADSVQYQYIGFSGKKLFRVTKQLILKIASAVITYELVVIQFNNASVSRKSEPSRNSFC